MANLNHKNYREIATILEKYGISGMSAVSIKRFEKNDKLMPPGMIHDNFKNITEDTSGVDWDNGTGKRTVSFEWNGCTVFYRDSEWADAFQKETGMVLSEK